MKTKINEGRGRRKGEGEREGEEGRRKGKKENKRRKNGKIITTGIIIHGRKGWREENGLDKVEHWFKYRWDDTETGLGAVEKSQGNEKVKGQEGRNGTRDEARQIVHGKEKRMRELGKGIF